MKEEVSKKLPEIAENAAAKAEQLWRQRAESEITSVKADRDRRLCEMQVRFR